MATAEMREAEGRVTDPDGIEEPLTGHDDDAHRRDQDQRALEAAREVFGLGVPVGMVLVGGPDRHRQREQGHDGREQVDERLERIGEQGDRAGEEIRPALEGDGEERGGD